MTATDFPFVLPRLNRTCSFLIAQSVAYRCKFPIMIGFVEEFSTQAPSHNSSVGQTRAQLAPTAFSVIIVFAEPFKFPEAIFFIKEGISIPVGHAVIHGAS